jgi:protein-ribulosamine 3-kinase
MNLQPVKELISKQLNTSISSLDLTAIGGGSINATYRLAISGSKNYFLKLNSSTEFPGLFQKEKSGLEFLASQNCILTPRVILIDTVDNNQLLLLEWIEPDLRDENFWKKFGEQLAALHSISNEHFGFYEDNYMGSLTQVNSHTNDWTEFFIRYRLQPQIELAVNKKLLHKDHVASFESLFKKLESIFNIEKPSLLHGDLWGGNFMCNSRSLPVLIDPAVYFGHRCIDLAMTTLFGGFDRVFYDSYQHHFALPANYDEQWDICNLYPLLIHLNLFGSGYLGQLEKIVRRFS